MDPQLTPYPSAKSSRVPMIVLGFLLVLALVFGFWSFGQMQSYKNSSDKKSAVAVESAKKQLTAQLQAQFDEKSKAPYKTYQGSPTYGTVTFNYPKSWSAYEAGGSDQAINTYFYPDIVPSTDSKNSYPLHVELLSADYAQTVEQFSNGLSDGSLKASAYVPPKMVGVANVTPGTRFDGAISKDGNSTQTGAFVILKVRDKTLKITTETAASVSDLNNIVLASLTFVP